MMGKGLYDLDSRAAAGENGDDRCNRLKIVWRTGWDVEDKLKAAGVSQVIDGSPRASVTGDRPMTLTSTSGTLPARSGRMEFLK